MTAGGPAASAVSSALARLREPARARAAADTTAPPRQAQPVPTAPPVEKPAPPDAVPAPDTAAQAAADPPQPAPRTRQPRRGRGAADALRRVSRGLGELLVTFGAVVLLFVGYQLWFTGLYTQQQQSQLRHQITQRWQQPRPASQQQAPAAARVLVEPSEGAPVAELRIPRLGGDYDEVIVQGVGHEDLKTGPGHYPGTAMPGGVGNFAVAGHRTTYGAPFNRVDELKTGDPIVVETRDTWFTYRVTGEQIVSPSAIEVTYPVPDQAGAVPTQRLLTFTTCNPKYSARERLIVHGVLESALPRSTVPLPPALAAPGH